MTIKHFTQRIGRTILLSSLLASFLVPSAFAGGPTAANRAGKRQSVQKTSRAKQLEKAQQLSKAKTLLQILRAEREERASNSPSLMTATQSADQNPLVTSSGSSGMGSSRNTFPVFHSRLRWDFGSNTPSRNLSSTPIWRRTFIEFGII